MAELTWTASTNVSWVHISPSTGVGSNDNVSVSIDAASGPNDDSSASITITTSTGDVQQIPVIRCLPECSCQSMGFSGKELNLDSSGKTHENIGKYDSSSPCSNSMNVVTDGIVLTNPTKEGDYIYADVNTNNGDARTGWYRFLFDGEICLEKIVTQRRGVDSCEDAACTAISVTFEGGDTSIHVDDEGGTYRFATSYSSDCWSLTKTSKSENWLSVNENSITVAENGGSSPTRSGYVTFTFTNSKTGNTCKHKLTITQDKKPEPVCDCTEFTATGITDWIAASGGTNIVIGSISMASCMSNPRGEDHYPWVSDVTFSGNNVMITIEPNTDTRWRTDVIFLSVDTEEGGICKSWIRIHQNGTEPTPPTPPDCKIIGDDSIDSCGGGTVQYEITQD